MMTSLFVGDADGLATRCNQYGVVVIYQLAGWSA